MSSSLLLYDMSPAVAVSVPEISGIGAERQGKEGSGVKSWAPCFLYNHPEIIKFLELLKVYRGVVLIRDNGQSVGVRCGALLDKGNLWERRQMSEILYFGVVIPSLVDSLEDGRYHVSRFKNLLKRMSKNVNNQKHQITAGCCE